jgi:predicted metal-dependent HD superfamily phosphohydrolase
MDFFYMRDIDWSGFGRSWLEYNGSTADIRLEVPYITDTEFKINRIGFLRALIVLDRPLYCTEWFSRLEGTAKDNIRKDLNILMAQNTAIY